MILQLLAAALLVQGPHRSIVIDEPTARDARISVGDRVVIALRPGARGDTVVVSAIMKRSTDPAEVARRDYKVRMHLDHLQTLAEYGDRVDRFAVKTRSPELADSAIAAINAAAFGFLAHRSADIAVETSRTFQVVSRFHKAIGVITIVASAVFLLCIMLLKVEERRREVAALRLMGVSASTVVRSIVLEAAFVSVAGSAIGVVMGWLASLFVNWFYRNAYETPLTFAIVTPGIAAFAVALSLMLGIGAGAAAAMRLVRTPPLALFGR